MPYLIITIFAVILIYLVICFVMSGTVIYLNRQPVPKTPKDYGLEYEPVEFRAEDGVLIRGWLLPGSGNKLIILTHVGGLTKYGSTVSYKNISKLYNKEVEFVKTAKNLVREGYSVLMFDFRNHGESEISPNGGKAGVGLEEYKDVVAAMKYIKSHKDLSEKEVGFVSFCMGANSTIIAMSKEPEVFKDVKCLMAIQPISMKVFVRSYVKRLVTPVLAASLLPGIEMFVNLRSEHKLKDMSPKTYAKDIRVPTLFVQARNDSWTELSDIQSFYDAAPVEKEFFWIEDTKHRFESYTYFQDRPEKMLEWLKKWM